MDGFHGRSDVQAEEGLLGGQIGGWYFSLAFLAGISRWHRSCPKCLLPIREPEHEYEMKGSQVLTATVLDSYCSRQLPFSMPALSVGKRRSLGTNLLEMIF